MRQRLLLSMALFVTSLVGCASGDEPPPGHKVVARFMDLPEVSSPAEGQDARLVLPDGTVVIGTYRHGAWGSWRAGGGEARIVSTKTYTKKKEAAANGGASGGAAAKECYFCITKQWPDSRQETQCVLIPCP